MGCANKIHKTSMWSGMLPELLNIISRNIVFYEDYLAFACVCKSWHSAAAQQGHDSTQRLPSRFPSLILGEKEKDGREFLELFLLANKSIRKIRLPEAYGKVCRSSCGWLATVGRDDHATQLINPLSRETINLPKVDTFDPEILRDLKREEGIKKLLIVTNNPSSLKLPIVVVLLGQFAEMGLCRPGDNKWTTVGHSNYIGDITYYNRQVYTIDRLSYCIEACDVHGEDPPTLVSKSSLMANFRDLGHGHDQLRGTPYIIGLDEGERKRLLVVIRQGSENGFFKSSKAKRFLLYAYDLDDERWSIVKDFGKKTLFIGLSSTFWVEDTTGAIKSNCIYFTDDHDKSKNGCGGDMGIYHLSNGTIEPHFSGESRSLFTPPIWLESM